MHAEPNTPIQTALDTVLGIRLPSPLQEVHLPVLTQRGVTLLIKRDDLIHQEVSGNKYRKLTFTLEDAVKEGHTGVITFGGAFSNHLYATAAACHALQIPCTAFVRGEDDPSNPTLSHCREKGMQLIFLDRTQYRQKEACPAVATFLRMHPGHLLIPEGGTTPLAVKGAAVIVEEISAQLPDAPSFMVTAGGTGGTAAGILCGLPLHTQLIVFSALKSDHLIKDIIHLADPAARDKQVQVFSETQFGGYGKWNDTLLSFIAEFEQQTHIPLDPIYTGKAMFRLMDQIEKGVFAPGTSIVFIHTGGLQGRQGVLHRNHKNSLV